jgi:Domain of unknown function (DUF4340)
MIRRNTWIILAIFVVVLGVGWYLLHVKTSSPAPVSSTPSPGKLLTGLTADKIKAIKYIDVQGIQVSLVQQANNQWVQQSPSNTPLTQGNIQEIISQLLDMNILTDLTSPPPASALGLDKPTTSLIITTDKDIVFSVGNPTPLGNGYYVQVDQSNPVIIDKPTVDNLVELFKSTQNTPTPQTTPTFSQGTPTPTTSTGY